MAFAECVYVHCVHAVRVCVCACVCSVCVCVCMCSVHKLTHAVRCGEFTGDSYGNNNNDNSCIILLPATGYATALLLTFPEYWVRGNYTLMTYAMGSKLNLQK